MADSPVDRRTAGEARVRAALEHIEEAQIHLSHACAALAAEIGYVKEWERAAKLMQTVKAYWYRVDTKLHTTSRGDTGLLDHDPKPDEHPHKGCCHGALRGSL